MGYIYEIRGTMGKIYEIIENCGGTHPSNLLYEESLWAQSEPWEKICKILAN